MDAVAPPVVFPRAGTIPAKHALPAPVEQREWLCGGEIRLWDGPRADVLSPVCVDDGAGGLAPVRVGSHPLLGEREALEALEAAGRAWDRGRGPWPTATVEERIRSVEAFAWRMKERRAEVVSLLMWEIGKTLADAEKEFDRTVDYVRDTIDAVKEIDRVSSRFLLEQGVHAQVRRAPLGVTLCMGPFNYPVNETFATLIPALVMGNVAIVKPPKLGVLCWRPLLEAFRDCFPPGVVNIVPGDGPTVVGPLMTSGRVDVLAFIGTSRVADILKHQHPKPHRLRCVLGLDAKNAAIVLPDADLDLAVKECVLGALSYNGQRCTAIKMIFVHASLADAFLAKLCAAVDALKRGMPWEEGVTVTPLPEPGKPARMRELIDDAVARGARVANARGGGAHGTFLAPAVLYPVASGSRLWSEEQFGPIVPVAPFADEEEPLRWVAESAYGQQASVFGRDPAAVARLVDTLVNQVCRVNVNSQCQRGPDSLPFTGRKDSAEGTLSVSDALKVFTIRTLVAAKDVPANRDLLRSIVRERRSRFLSTDWIF